MFSHSKSVASCQVTQAIIAVGYSSCYVQEKEDEGEISDCLYAVAKCTSLNIGDAFVMLGGGLHHAGRHSQTKRVKRGMHDFVIHLRVFATRGMSLSLRYPQLVTGTCI